MPAAVKAGASRDNGVPGVGVYFILTLKGETVTIKKLCVESVTRWQVERCVVALIRRATQPVRGGFRSQTETAWALHRLVPALSVPEATGIVRAIIDGSVTPRDDDHRCVTVTLAVGPEGKDISF